MKRMFEYKPGDQIQIEFDRKTLTPIYNKDSAFFDFIDGLRMANKLEITGYRLGSKEYITWIAWPDVMKQIADRIKQTSSNIAQLFYRELA